MLEKYAIFEKQVNETMTNIKGTIKTTHDKMIQQVESKVNSKEIVGAIQKLQSKGNDIDVFTKLVG